LVKQWQIALRSTNLYYGGKFYGNTDVLAPLQNFQPDAFILCNIWKNKMRAAYGKAWRKSRNAVNAALKPASGAAEASADSDTDEEGDQFFFAYSLAPETDSVKEGGHQNKGIRWSQSQNTLHGTPAASPTLWWVGVSLPGLVDKVLRSGPD
jgi:hypothetical protein